VRRARGGIPELNELQTFLRRTLNMNMQSMHKGRRVFVTFIVAATLALTLAFGQSAVGKVFGVDWTPTAYACEGVPGGC